MCGFAGFSFNNKKLLKEIGLTLKSRAIDNEYFYYNDNLSFYHAHLSIEDLDKDTSQPLVYENLVIGLVGEIYNKEYLLELSGIDGKYKNFTELEVIGISYKKLGKDFINYVNGEFAIFIYDNSINKYFLYRDRWGTNNIYYKIKNNNLFFASEIKSLILEKLKINKSAFIEFMTFQFCISPNTIIEGINTLRPGTYLEFYNGNYKIYNLGEYKFQEKNDNIISAIENAIIRRIPKFQKRIFLSLSGGPDSNLILYFLNKYYSGKIVAYSFKTKLNEKEIDIASKNTKKLGIKHLIIDMNNYNSNIEEDIYIHEGLVNLPNLEKIIREKFPEYSDIKVEFGGDGKEELILGNNHFPYKEILGRYKYFRSKGLIRDFDITQEFLNKEMFDYNLQMIDKITLSNGIERRMPFTDYELLKFFKHKNYRKEVEKFLNSKGLEVIEGEYGYDLGINFKNLYDKDLVKKKNIIFKKIYEKKYFN